MPEKNCTQASREIAAERGRDYFDDDQPGDSACRRSR
jgi:hypothetical protein